MHLVIQCWCRGRVINITWINGISWVMWGTILLLSLNKVHISPRVSFALWDLTWRGFIPTDSLVVSPLNSACLISVVVSWSSVVERLKRSSYLQAITHATTVIMRWGSACFQSKGGWGEMGVNHLSLCSFGCSFNGATQKPLLIHHKSVSQQACLYHTYKKWKTSWYKVHCHQLA